MNVLFPINEAMGIYKIGGLGDVGAALPPRLAALGIDVRLALPRHPEIDLTATHALFLRSFTISYDGDRLTVRVYRSYLPSTNVPVYLFDEDVYLSQHTDASDNHADKYAVFSLAVATWMREDQSWRPDIVHLHDWHTSLIPLITKHVVPLQHLHFVLTIHNLAYQGVTKTQVAKKVGLLPHQCTTLDWDMLDGDTNILLEGILHADEVTTVSATYAQEILTSEYGETLEHILKQKQSHLHGILNGLDQELFDPEHDQFLHTRYAASDVIKGKKANKLALFEEYGWDTKEIDESKLIGFVGRVDGHQKGIQLLIEALEKKMLLPEKVYFVFLGTGDPLLESKLHEAGDSHERAVIITRFDEALSRKIYAASDLMLIPSKFEPCGLVQLIAMRYGALPIARKTGGLADTIDHKVTGFLFDAYTTEAMCIMIRESLEHIENQDMLETMRKAALAYDSSWTSSAAAYASLYANLLLENSRPNQPIH